MADFVEFTDAETNTKAFFRQAYEKKMKDNFTNLNARVVGRDPRVFEHFNRIGLSEEFVNLGVFQAGPYSTVTPYGHGDSGGQNIGIHTNRLFQFDGETRPLIVKGRIKKLLDVAQRLGLQENNLASPFTDVKGIWLERLDASNWRFVSYDTARNNGTSFTKPSDNTWFEVSIEFTGTPSNQALCRLDGVLKETLTTQLPTAVPLFGLFMFKGSGASPGNAVSRIDRIEYSAFAFLDAT